MTERPALAIVAGSGTLPKLLAQSCAEARRPYRVVRFEGVELDWSDGHPILPAVFEKPGRLFADLRKAQVGEVTFAGGMRRPKLNPMRFDVTGLRLAPTLFRALKSGDDDTLRVVARLFEAEGHRVRAPHELLTDLLAPEGVLGVVAPTAEDRADAERAATIVAALGAIDIGQGAVVAQGLCLGVEAIAGTDALLAEVGRQAGAFLPDPAGGKGVLLKAPKPGQDWRIDLPTIGPATIERAADAGLAGVVVQADSVLVLGLKETVATADARGIFLWGRRGPTAP